ncbi:MAG: MFS transporter [Rubellimicrobium sp.]|nr:MFS transporter [Rubellimicrobium sp.]
MVSQKRRIWGWMFFDWAQQPYATLGLTFVFGPYFAAVATRYYAGLGVDTATADAQAQSLWSLGQALSGLVIAFTAPFVGAWADASGRKMPWIAVFSVVLVLCASSLWFLGPDGALLVPVLLAFSLGFIAGESALNVSNAILPSLGNERTVGRISGSGAAFGYWGGVLSLVLMLLFLAENDQGVTLLGNPPAFGLDPDAREGTRFVGPFIAIWYAVFIIPFFLWVPDGTEPPRRRVSPRQVWTELMATLRSLVHRRSLGAFLLGSMLYRDALNGIYAFGGVYATLVLQWSIIQVGVFGVVGAVSAAVLTWMGGLFDARYGPKPVILVSIWTLITVCTIIIGMSRTSFFGFPIPEGSNLPDIVFYICGAAIGGAGGSIYSASRTMMVRHSHPDRPAEAFGLFALSGKATAFLAPMLIGLFTWITNSNRLGFLPVIGLFLIGLFLLRFVDSNGDRSEWVVALPQSR